MSLPYVPLYVTDFKADTSHLTTSQIGVYFRLVMECWTTPGCTIPNDVEWILDRIMSRKDDEDQVRADVKLVLGEFFKIKKNRAYQGNLLEIYVTQNDKHKSRKMAGKKGALAKSLKNNDLGSSNAKAKLKQPEPEPEPDIIDKSIIDAPDKPKPKKPRSRATALPPDWHPEPISQELKNKLQMTRDEYVHELSKFKDHAEANGRTQKSWQAAWRTWLQSDYSTYGKRKGAKAGTDGQGAKGMAAAVQRVYDQVEQRRDDCVIDITANNRQGDGDSGGRFDGDAGRISFKPIQSDD